MNKTQAGLKRKLTVKLTVILTFFLSVLIALSIIQLPVVLTAFAASDTTQPSEPDAVELSLTNPQFASGSGSYPMTPDGWTGGGVSDSDAGATVSGIVDLTAEAYNKETKDEDVYKLSRYPEYKTGVPQTPFGTSSYEGTNKKVLMINTAGSETAYGFTSASVSVSANKFYKISAYVKTGDFSEGKGAAIKINGLPEELAFKNINTVKDIERDAAGLPILSEENMYGFKQYTFYIAAPSFTSSDVTLSLQVGDRNDEEDNIYYNPAKGYAFFDNVVAEELSPNAFKHETSAFNGAVRDNYILADFSKGAQYLTNSGDITYLYDETPVPTGVDIGSFENGMADWKYITDVEDVSATGLVAGIYDTNGSFTEDNIYNLETRPFSPIGNQPSGGKIFVMSSQTPVAAGYRSTEFTVLRNTFYRISYWVNAENIQGGSGPSAVIRGENGIVADKNKLAVVASNLSGDSAATMRYGWKEYAFYVKGSAIKDYKISMELWLGQPNNPTSGTAMFDEVKVEKLSSSDYSSNSSSGTIVTFDPSFTDTGVSNGMFYEVGDYDEYKYPLTPASWTKVTPATAETNGFSNKEVESAEDVISGIISTEVEHFDANRKNYNNAANPAPGGANMLMVSSVADTAISYRSPSLTVSAGSKYKLDVSLKAADVKGYGANLVVKNGNNVIATIEGITDTVNDFKTYSFYLEGGMSDQSVTLEIWLGMNDRKDNKSKLASGTLFVNKVSFKTMEESDNYSAHAERYANLKSAEVKKLDFAAYSFASLDMSAYDYYGQGTIKTPYNWSLTAGAQETTVYGIFDYTNLKSGGTEIPESFKNEENAPNNGVLYLRNTAPYYSKITTVNTLALAENSYYKISFNVKVDLPQNMLTDENAVGAGIELSGTDFKFKNIKDTSTVKDTVTDKETFKTYTFYVKTSEAKEISLALSLGDNTYPNRYCAGRVYVNQISVLSINNVDYEEAVKIFHDDDKENDDPYLLEADLSSPSDDNTDNGDEENQGGTLAWWLIPSILFAAALLIAVIGTAIRRLLDKRAVKKEVQVVNSYDRSKTLNKIHNENAAKSGDADKVKADGVSDSDETYDEFDEGRPVESDKSQQTAKVSAPNDYDEFDDEPIADKPEAAQQSETEQTAVTERAESQTDGAFDVKDGKTDAKTTAETAPVKPAPIKAEPNKVQQKPTAPIVKSDAYNDEFED